MSFKIILGHLPYSFEADPFVTKKKGIYHLFNHDLLGIKEHISRDGLHFKFLKYHVLGAIRPFVKKNKLYYEKILSLANFPFYKSHLRSRRLNSKHDKLILSKYDNHSCPSIIDHQLFFSTNYKKMDHGFCEPTSLKILNGPNVSGLDNISSIRKFKDQYLGTLIENVGGISYAKIVHCIPIKFPNVWQIGSDFLTAKDIGHNVTHVYIPSIIDKKLYVNVRFGRRPYSPEKIILLPL